MSAASSGISSASGRHAAVAQELEPGNHHGRLGTLVRAVDRAALLRALEDRNQDLEQELLRPGHLDARSSEVERRLEQLAHAIRTVSGRAPRRGPRRDRARQPRQRRRGRPVSTRRRSRSAPRPSAPGAVRDGEEAVEQRRLCTGFAYEQEPATGRTRQRPFSDERGESCGHDGIDGVAAVRKGPGTGARRCGGSRLRRLRPCGEPRGCSRHGGRNPSLPPGGTASMVVERRARDCDRNCNAAGKATCSDSEWNPGIALRGASYLI